MSGKRDLLRMIGRFCGECMGGPRATEGVWPIKNAREIEECSAPECIWFRYRSGRDPNKGVRTDAQKALDHERSIRWKAQKSTISAPVV